MYNRSFSKTTTGRYLKEIEGGLISKEREGMIENAMSQGAGERFRLTAHVFLVRTYPEEMTCTCEGYPAQL